MSNYLTGLSQLNPQVKRHNGSTATLTLDSAGTTNATMLYVNGVAQSPGVDFNVSGSTLTCTSTLPAGTNIATTIQYFNTGIVNTPADATVTNAKTNFVSTSSAAGLQIKGDGTTDGTLQLNCSQNSHGIKIKSPPHSASASYTLTMPNDDGDANEFLQTNGSGVLDWASAGGGAWTLIGTASASDSANLTVTGIDSSTYDTHAFIFTSILPASSGQNLYMRLGTSGGIITASNYLWHVSEASTGTTSWANQKGENVAEAKIAIEPTNSSNRGGAGGTIYLTNNNGTNHPTWTGVHAASKVTYMSGGFTMGILNSASNIDRVQLYFQSGNVTSGRLSVYGIAHA